MPPITPRRSPASTLPTVVSLSKLLHLVPTLLSNRHVKRGAEYVIQLDHGNHDEPPTDSPEYLFKLLLSVALVLLGGVFAGLTLALMGSDDLNLRVLAASSSDPKERASASKVLRLLSRGRHWVLVVLLLSNVIVNESLPIFLDQVLGGGVRAVVVSTIMIVIFGEVIPQAVCVRYGLAIGGACAPMVHFMMILFAPIAWPIAKLLDWVLGHDVGHTYKKAELKSFLQFHREGEEPLRDDEIVILNGVLSLNDRKVSEIMTPIEDCLTLPANEVLDNEVVEQILLSGFSRIPIHEPDQKDNFIGMLLVKRLIPYNPDDEWPVSKFPLLPLPEAKPNLNCFQALDYFQTGRAHLLLVSETPGRRGGALGILSLEDLIEEIIGEEIVDETDQYQDNHSKRKAHRKATGQIMRGIIERQRVINAFSHRPSGHTSNSRPASPHPREGVLVQISETPVHDEPDNLHPDMASPRMPADISIIATTPDGGKIYENSPGDVKRENSGALTAEEIAKFEADGEGTGKTVGQASEAKEERAEEDEAYEDGDEDTGSGSEGTATPGSKEQTDKDASKESNPDAKLESGEPNAASDATPSYAAVAAEPEPKPANGSSKAAKKKRKGKKKGAAEPHPTMASFEAAARGFVSKYESCAAAGTGELGPGRTNRGWEVVTKSTKYRAESYLHRRQTRLLPMPASEGEDEMEDDDPSALQATASRVQVDYSIVWSASYRVPMLWFAAWDETGAPLGFDALVALLLHAGATTGTERREDAIMLPHAPFPLLASAEHPITGMMGWSVHPCEVRGAVDEIVAGEGDEGEEYGVRWLEAWVMLCDSVVDLSYA